MKRKPTPSASHIEEVLTLIRSWGECVFKLQHVTDASGLPPAVVSQTINHLYIGNYINADEYDEHERPVWYYLTTKGGGNQD